MNQILVFSQPSLKVWVSIYCNPRFYFKEKKADKFSKYLCILWLRKKVILGISLCFELIIFLPVFLKMAEDVDRFGRKILY